MTDKLAPGGAEHVLVSLASRLPRPQFVQHVAWLDDDDRLVGDLRPHVESLVPLHVGKGRSLLSAAYALGDWIRIHRPHVVHAQLLRAQMVARLAARLAGHRAVLIAWHNSSYTDCAIDSYFGGSKKKREIIRLLERCGSLFDTHYLAVSNYVAQHYVEHLSIDPRRVTVVMNPIEPARYAPVSEEVLRSTRATLGVPADAPLLISVGRLVPGKGHSDSLRALSIVRRSYPKATLLLAGTGRAEADFRAEAQACGLEEHVRFLGYRSDIPALLQLADVFVFPTRHEGLSVALGEALANGIPAVVSDIPQNHEVGGYSGSLKYVPLGSVEALASSIVGLLDRGDRVRNEARLLSKTVRERFSPESITARFGGVLMRVAQEASPPTLLDDAFSMAGSLGKRLLVRTAQ